MSFNHCAPFSHWQGSVLSYKRVATTGKSALFRTFISGGKKKHNRMCVGWVFFWLLNCLWDEETRRIQSAIIQAQCNIRYFYSSSAHVIEEQLLHSANLREFGQRWWIYEEVSEPVFFEPWEVSGYWFFVRRFNDDARRDASCYCGRPATLQHKQVVF